MVRKFTLVAASMALVTSSQPILAKSAVYRISAKVGVYCKVQHQSGDYGQQSGDTITLGKNSRALQCGERLRAAGELHPRIAAGHHDTGGR